MHPLCSLHTEFNNVRSTGSVSSRAEALDEQLRKKAVARGVNFLAHSMGGLDCRHLITHVKPQDYTPLSLTTIATPHRGSPFMDWCAVRHTFLCIGLGLTFNVRKTLVSESSLTTILLLVNLQKQTTPKPVQPQVLRRRFLWKTRPMQNRSPSPSLPCLPPSPLCYSPF